MAEQPPLTQLPRALIDAGFPQLKYRAVYQAATDGVFPAARTPSMWTYDPADVPQIADALGLSHAVAA